MTKAENNTARWKTVRLGDVAKTSSGGTPNRGVGAYYGGEIPWVKSGELGDSTVYETQERISKAGLENSSAKLFPKGTLCVALYGATVGKLGILGMDAATNQAVCGIFLPEEIDTRFAYRFLESKRRDLIEMGKGGAQSNISQQIIRELEFPFPPTDEQRRIVAEIEKQFTRLEAGVAALRRLQANLKRYRAAVLKAACEGRLVPTEAELHRKLKTKNSKLETGAQLLARILAERRQNWQGRGKYKEPAAPDSAKLGTLPQGWAWASVDQLLIEPLCNGVSIKGSDEPPGVRALRLSAMSDSGFDYSDARYLPLSDSDRHAEIGSLPSGLILSSRKARLHRATTCAWSGTGARAEPAPDAPSTGTVPPHRWPDSSALQPLHSISLQLHKLHFRSILLRRSQTAETGTDSGAPENSGFQRPRCSAYRPGSNMAARFRPASRHYYGARRCLSPKTAGLAVSTASFRFTELHETARPH